MTRLKKRGHAQYWLFPMRKLKEYSLGDGSTVDIKETWGHNCVTLSWGHYQEPKKKTRQINLDEILDIIGDGKLMKSSIATLYLKSYSGMDLRRKKLDLDLGLNILLQKNILQTDSTKWYFWRTAKVLA